LTFKSGPPSLLLCVALALNYWPLLFATVFPSASVIMLLRIESEFVIGISFLLVPVVSFLLLCKLRLDCRIDQSGHIIVRNFARSYRLNPVDVDHIAERAFLLGCGDVYPVLVSGDGRRTPALALYHRKEAIHQFAESVRLLSGREHPIPVEHWTK
jgi:hypothetical protein